MLRWADTARSRFADAQSWALSTTAFIILIIVVYCSGSNNVLDSMRREYTVEEFEKVANFLRTNVSSV